MTGDDPRRLKDGGDAPAELVRALDALGRRDRDAARLSRVAEKLGAALVDAPPPSAAESGAGKWLGTKTILAGVVTGVAVVSLWVSPWREDPAPARSPELPAGVDPSPQPVAAPQPPASPTPPAVAPTISDAPERAPKARTSGHVRRAVRSGTGPAESPQPSDDSVSGPAGDGVAGPGERSATADAPGEPADAREPREPKKDATEPAEAPRSEVELLFEARKAMRSQPMAALRLLDEHCARYPHGQLEPEREVLRIEALRKLGRVAEANRTLYEFQARFPKSIHLRRLQGDAGSTLAK